MSEPPTPTPLNPGGATAGWIASTGPTGANVLDATLAAQMNSVTAGAYPTTGPTGPNVLDATLAALMNSGTAAGACGGTGVSGPA